MKTILKVKWQKKWEIFLIVTLGIIAFALTVINKLFFACRCNITVILSLSEVQSLFWILANADDDVIGEHLRISLWLVSITDISKYKPVMSRNGDRESNNDRNKIKFFKMRKNWARIKI